tara:strand:- start:26 stop:169 length:144 start_codon:yes stop_codon:yes gene_type:complete
MNKYVDRLMDEVYDNFRRHFTKEEKIEFLNEFIKTLENELDYIDSEE